MELPPTSEYAGTDLSSLGQEVMMKEDKAQ